MTILTARKAAAAAGVLLTLGLASCSDTNDVTNDPVDDSSTTTPEEGDNGGEEDTSGPNDDT